MTLESPVADSVNSNRVNNRELYAVVHSRTFSRSDQLQAFLRYICDLELAGRGNEISEYSIATEALHRPAAYAPGEDSSVRSRAHALRRKLDEYYETEAPQSELRIELPKGSYRPIFVAKRQQPVPIRTTATPTLKQRRWLAPGILIAAILITAALTSLLVRRDAIDPLVREARGPILHPGGDVLLLISAPPMFRPVQSQPDRKPLPQSTTLEPAPAWASQWFDNQHLDSRGGPLYLAPKPGLLRL